MSKVKLIKNTLGLDDIVSNLPNDCETEITLKIQKKKDTYGILSYEYRKESEDLITNVKVSDK